MTDKIVEPTKPLSTHYRVIATGEILPALKTPPGYEDAHPRDYEAVDAPARATDTKPAPAAPAPAPAAPVAPAPAAPAPAPQA